MKLLIKTSPHYDARSEEHQIKSGISLVRAVVLREILNCHIFGLIRFVTWNIEQIF
jgi:hypothetical protein